MASAPAACIIVDTDAAADDLRSIAILHARRNVVAIVTTGGGTHAGIGAAIIRRVFDDAGVSAPIILVGRGTPDRVSDPVEIAYEDNAEHPYGPSLAFAAEPAEPDLRQALLASLLRCSTVELVVIGPWTSVTAYLPLPGLTSVMAQGRPDRGWSSGTPVSWNCRHDAVACSAAQRSLGGIPIHWIDVPASAETDWSVSQAMIDGFPKRGFGGVLRRVAEADVGRIGWRGMWDDLVALAVLDAGLFKPVGSHFEPDADRTVVVAAWQRGFRE